MAPYTPLRHTDGDTLSMLLPAAEVEVMRIIWSRGPLTVKAVHQQITTERELAYTTVMTTMVRLAEKGLLQRESAHTATRGWPYTYTAAISERELVTRTLQQILDCVVHDYPSALAQYLDMRRELATA
jgi:predicted transcriptional regulator